MVRALIAGLLLVSGCSHTLPMWHADARFTPEERLAIVKGEAWIAEQGGHDPGGVAFDLETTDAVAPWTIRRERGPGARGGATGECLGGAVYLGLEGNAEVNEPPLSLELLPGLTAHEMAHCRYGFVDGYHVGDEPTDGIMRVLNPMRWTSSEEAQCARTNCRAE